MSIGYQKLEGNTHIGFWLGPSASGALGITDVGEPLAAEINNTGGASGMLEAAPSTSWDDWSFGTEASETLNEPSLADASTFEEFGQSNFGGNVSHYYPRRYDDNSNQHSLIYDLVAIPGTKIDAVVRLDGEVKQDEDAVNGDFVFVYRVQSEGETNPFTPGESKRYTKTYIPKGEFAHCIPVGDQAITAVGGSTLTPAPAAKGRIRALIQGRDVSCMLNYETSDGAVIQIEKGGWYTVTGADTTTATITISHPFTNDTATVAVTVTE